MNYETVKQALALLESGEDFAWATIIEQRGSSPRHKGAAMGVRSDGTIFGTIGGGALEAQAIKRAHSIFKEKAAALMEFNLTAQDSANLGMICGGRGQVLIDYIDASNPGETALFQGMMNVFNTGGKACMVSVIPRGTERGGIVEKSLVDAEGVVVGAASIPAELLREIVRAAGVCDQIVNGAACKVLVQQLGGRGTAYVFGAGHCGQKLVPILSMVGFITVVLDDRSEFANRQRFPLADRFVVLDSFENALEDVPVDEDSYIVILTRGHLHDRTVLKAALSGRAGYVGMIGSRNKVAETFRSLRFEGVTDKDLSRVFSPIGLSIGAETPEEIAVSIAAEMIKVRAAGPGSIKFAGEVAR